MRNFMLKRDMEFRPFYLFVRQFVCNLKITLRNSVITPLKMLNISIADCQIFWWWIERHNHEINLLQHLHINECS